MSDFSREEGAAIKAGFESSVSRFTIKEGFVFRVESTNWPDPNARIRVTLQNTASESRIPVRREAEYAAILGHSAGTAIATRIHSAIPNQSNDEKP